MTELQNDERTLHFANVDEFVREYLRFMYRRAVGRGGRVWAADWWRYDEAITRLEALWRAWEHLRVEDPATGISIWFRDHADHHMNILMDPDGPFAAADPNNAENQAAKGEPLPYKPPPAEMFE